MWSQTWASAPLQRCRGPGASVCPPLAAAWVGGASHSARLVLRRGLPTDRYMWSDATGLQERTKAGTKPPSVQWAWVSPGRRGGGAGSGGPACTDCPFPRFPTGLWTSAFPGALTQRGGSTPVTSLRKHLSLCLPGWPLLPLPGGAPTPALPPQAPGLGQGAGLACHVSCQRGLGPDGEVWRGPGDLGWRTRHLASVDGLREDSIAPPTPGCVPSLPGQGHGRANQEPRALG